MALTGTQGACLSTNRGNKAQLTLPEGLLGTQGGPAPSSMPATYNRSYIAHCNNTHCISVLIIHIVSVG